MQARRVSKVQPEACEGPRDPWSDGDPLPPRSHIKEEARVGSSCFLRRDFPPLQLRRAATGLKPWLHFPTAGGTRSLKTCLSMPQNDYHLYFFVQPWKTKPVLRS